MCEACSAQGGAGCGPAPSSPAARAAPSGDPGVPTHLLHQHLQCPPAAGRGRKGPPRGFQGARPCWGPGLGLLEWREKTFRLLQAPRVWSLVMGVPGNQHKDQVVSFPPRTSHHQLPPPLQCPGLRSTPTPGSPSQGRAVGAWLTARPRGLCVGHGTSNRPMSWAPHPGHSGPSALPVTQPLSRHVGHAGPPSPRGASLQQLGRGAPLLRGRGARGGELSRAGPELTGHRNRRDLNALLSFPPGAVTTSLVRFAWLDLGVCHMSGNPDHTGAIARTPGQRVPCCSVRTGGTGFRGR